MKKTAVVGVVFVWVVGEEDEVVFWVESGDSLEVVGEGEAGP